MINIRQKSANIHFEVDLSNMDLIGLRTLVSYGLRNYEEYEFNNPAVITGKRFLELTEKYIVPE